MTDLEQRLRSGLQDLAGGAPSPAADGDRHAEARGRARRRRQQGLVGLAAVAALVVGAAVLATDEGDPDTLRVVDTTTTTSTVPTTTTSWPTIEVALETPVGLGTARMRGVPAFVAAAPDESEPVFYVSERLPGQRENGESRGNLVRYEGVTETARIEVGEGPVVVSDAHVVALDSHSVHVLSRSLTPRGAAELPGYPQSAVIRGGKAFVLITYPEHVVARVSLDSSRVEEVRRVSDVAHGIALLDGGSELLLVGAEPKGTQATMVALDPRTLAERRRVPLPVVKVQDAVLARGRLYLVPELTEPGRIHVADPVSGRLLGTVDTWWPRHLVADDAIAYVSVRRVDADGSPRMGDGMIGLFQLEDHVARGYSGPCGEGDAEDAASRLALNREYLFVACTGTVEILAKADDARTLAEEREADGGEISTAEATP